MTIVGKMQAHADAVRARLWRPPNAVVDRGFENGKAVKAALLEIMQRGINDHLQFEEEARLYRIIRRASRR